MAPNFDIKTAISLLPVMTGQEEVTKQLVDSILLYDSMISDATKSQLIEFVLKTRLSASAKLRLKSSYTNVQDLVGDIKKYLLPKKSVEAIQSQLFRTKQGRRSIEAFGSEVENLFVNLTIAQSEADSAKYEILRPLNEKTAIKRFADGLSDTRLSTIIAARQFSSLPEAIRTAIDEEISSAQDHAMHFRPAHKHFKPQYKTGFNSTNNRYFYKSKNYGQRPSFENVGHKGGFLRSPPPPPPPPPPPQSRGARAPPARTRRMQLTQHVEDKSPLRNDNRNEFFRA